MKDDVTVLEQDEEKRYAGIAASDRITRCFGRGAEGQSVYEKQLVDELVKFRGPAGSKKIKLILIKGQQGDGISWTLQSLMEKTRNLKAKAGHPHSVVPWPQASGEQRSGSVSAELLAAGYLSKGPSQWFFILRHGSWRQRVHTLIRPVVSVVAIYILLVLTTWLLSPGETNFLEYLAKLTPKRLLFVLILSPVGAYVEPIISWFRVHRDREPRSIESHHKAFLKNEPVGDFAPLCSAYRARVEYYPILNVVDAAERLSEFDQQFILHLLFTSTEFDERAVAWVIAYTDSDAQFIKLIRERVGGPEGNRIDLSLYELKPLSNAERIAACELWRVPIQRASDFLKLRDLVKSPDTAEQDRLSKRWTAFLSDNGEELVPTSGSDRFSSVDLVKYLALSGAYAPDGFTPKQIGELFSDKNEVFSAHARFRNWKALSIQEVKNLLLAARQASQGVIVPKDGLILPAPELRSAIDRVERPRRNDLEFIHFFWAQYYSGLWQKTKSLDDFERVYYQLSRAGVTCPEIPKESLQKAVIELLTAVRPVAEQLLEACRFKHLAIVLAPAFNSLERAGPWLATDLAPALTPLVEIAWENFFFTGELAIVSIAEAEMKQNLPADQSEYWQRADLLQAYKDLISGKSPERLKERFGGSSTSVAPMSGRLGALQSLLRLECTLRFDFGTLDAMIASDLDFPDPVPAAADEVLPFEYKLIDRLVTIAIQRGDFSKALELLKSWGIQCDDFSKTLGPYELLQRALLRLYAARLVHFVLEILSRVENAAADQAGGEGQAGMPPVDHDEIVREALEVARFQGAPTTGVAEEVKSNLCAWVLDEYDHALALGELLDLEFVVIEAHLGRGLCRMDYSSWDAAKPDTWKEWDADLRAVVHLEQQEHVCLRSPEALIWRMDGLRSIVSLILTDAFALFRLSRNFSFARRAQVAFFFDVETVCVFASGQMLEELITAYRWWIDQINEDPLILEDRTDGVVREPRQEIISTYAMSAQAARRLDKLADAQHYLEEAETRIPLLAPSAQTPELVVLLGIQRIWLKQDQHVDWHADVDDLFRRRELYDEELFGYVIGLKLVCPPQPPDLGTVDLCLHLLTQHLERYHFRASAKAAVRLAYISAGHDRAHLAEIVALLSSIAANWLTGRVPEEMVSLYGTLRTYDPANRYLHEQSLSAWQVVQLRGEDLIRTEALYEGGKFLEVFDLLTHVFRFQTQRRIVSPLIREATELFDGKDYAGCLAKLKEVPNESLVPFYNDVDGQILLSFDRIELHRLQMECHKKLGHFAEARPFDEKLQLDAKNSIPKLLNGLGSSSLINHPLKDTLKLYIEMHDRFP